MSTTGEFTSADRISTPPEGWLGYSEIAPALAAQLERFPHLKEDFLRTRIIRDFMFYDFHALVHPEDPFTGILQSDLEKVVSTSDAFWRQKKAELFKDVFSDNRLEETMLSTKDPFPTLREHGIDPEYLLVFSPNENGIFCASQQLMIVEYGDRWDENMLVTTLGQLSRIYGPRTVLFTISDRIQNTDAPDWQIQFQVFEKDKL